MFDYLNTKEDGDDGNTSARSLDKLDKYTSKDTYKNKEKISSVSFVDNLITHSNVPEDTVYHLVKAVFENFSAFKKENPAFNNLNIQQMTKGGLAAPLPGQEGGGGRAGGAL